MSRKIPIYFDSIIASPIERISNDNPNLGRLRVGVFTKYGNRNGSYITDAVAEQLIRSATQGETPVVGFFDPETKDWAGHTGPTLASAYGYVEDFLGWEPLTDTDGISRDYAIFSVVVFTKYFEEAQYIAGQNQSMELDVESITGDWGDIDGREYFIYNTAKIQGLCIIGSHEPCFSVSSFFEKNDEKYQSQYEKFSSLLFDLKQQIEEAERNEKGGEQPMDELENKGLENTPADENTATQESENQEPAENQEPENQEPAAFENTEEDGSASTEENAPAEEDTAEDNNTSEEPSEFEALQAQFNDLQTSYNELNEQFTAAQARITELETFQTSANEELESLRNQNNELQGSIATYEAERTRLENERKAELIEQYAKVIDEEEIAPIREGAENFSYEELDSKLALCFAHKQMAGSENDGVVPLPETAVNQFALLMEKYRKN